MSRNVLIFMYKIGSKAAYSTTIQKDLSLGYL